MKQTRKPFYLKKKLLNQTKINIWNWDIHSLSRKLKNKKWNFLKARKNKNFELDSFRYRPFSYSYFKDDIKSNFRNNLYLRKLIRLKYARLKNKDLRSIYRKHGNNYKSLMDNLNSRLDVALFSVLGSKSIYQLRQIITHGKVTLNGRRVKSPSIHLSPFDVLSFKISDITNLNFLYRDSKTRVRYIIQLGYYLYNSSSFRLLDEKDQIKFINELSELIAPDHKDQVTKFYKDIFYKEYLKDRTLDKFSSLDKNFDHGVNVLPLKDFIDLFNRHLLQLKFFDYSNNLRNRLLFKKFSKSNSFDFFNVGSNLEVSVRGNYVDIIFLNSNIKDINNREKYLLHYLY